jgi:hypothetical protein
MAWECPQDDTQSMTRVRFNNEKNAHPNSPSTVFVRTGTLWVPLNNALPNHPLHCPLPQDKISTFLIAAPSTRSAVKNANSPPRSSRTSECG